LTVLAGRNSESSHATDADSEPAISSQASEVRDLDVDLKQNAGVEEISSQSKEKAAAPSNGTVESKTDLLTGQSLITHVTRGL
jgi:hypothetical protein